MLYRIETNDVHRFGFHLHCRDNKYIKSFFFENRSNAKLVRERDQISDVKIYYLVDPIDSEKVNAPHELLSSAGGKDPKIERFPDFWTSESAVTVTGKCKSFIEEVDPGVHQFIPFTVYKRNTHEPYEEPAFFRFICGRFIQLPRNPGPLSDAMGDIWDLRKGGPGIMDEYHFLRSIVERPDISEFIEQFPLWQLYEGGAERTHFANEYFIRSAEKHGLRGFKESSKDKRGFVTERDVSHIWYRASGSRLRQGHSRNQKHNAQGTFPVDCLNGRAQKAEMVDGDRGQDLRHDHEDDRVTNTEPRRDEGDRQHVIGDETSGREVPPGHLL
ncbi:MAG: hypothetical protein AAGE61_20985 [Pseudomonadota bacterium]